MKYLAHDINPLTATSVPATTMSLTSCRGRGSPYIDFI